MRTQFIQPSWLQSLISFSVVACLAACASTDPKGSDAENQDLSSNSVSDGGQDQAFSMTDGGEVVSVTRGGKRSAPKIAATPFQSDSRWMNAFYVVRSSSDSWETLSQMLYGRPDRAELLSSWNKGQSLFVGQVVYYNSPFRPDDSASMMVWSQDFGAELQKITVVAGESMSLIAQRLYGDVQSWREIAAVNPEITNPDLIQIGQELIVQPAQVDTAAALAKIIQQATEAAPVVASTENAAPPSSTQETNEIAQTAPPEQVDNTVIASEELTEEASPLTSSNLAAIAIGVIGLSLIGMILVRIRRRRAQDAAASENLAWSESPSTNVTNMGSPGASRSV